MKNAAFCRRNGSEGRVLRGAVGDGEGVLLYVLRMASPSRPMPHDFSNRSMVQRRSRHR
jgi:hypothetical protein